MIETPPQTETFPPVLPTEKSFVRTLVGVAYANRIPAVGLQSVALFLLWSYHFWPAARAALGQMALLKQNSGLGFAFVASAFASALLPLVLQTLQQGAHRRMVIGALPAAIVFWGLRGCLTDLFYSLQSAVWGNNALPLTIAIKVFCDLAIFTPCLSVPVVVLFFSWLDGDLRHSFREGAAAWWLREVWPLVRAAWVVWLPALMVIYALPTNLQFPISVLIQCFWTLFLVVLTDKGRTASSAA